MPASLLVRITRLLLAYYRRSGSYCYRQRATWGCAIHGGRVTWAQSATAAVPVRVDGEGKVDLGEHAVLGYLLAPKSGNGEILLQARTPEARVRIGDHTVLSNNVTVIAMDRIRIGNHCLIGDGVLIFDSDGHEIPVEHRRRSAGPSAPVTIGDHVWIGSRCIILKGVEIGAGSIVAAGSVVTRSVPPGVVAAGVPARVVRSLCPDDLSPVADHV